MPTYRAIFKRIAAELVLGTALAVTPALSAAQPARAPVTLVPPDAVPNFIPGFYKTLRQIASRTLQPQAVITPRIEHYISPPFHPLLNKVLDAPHDKAKKIAQQCGPTLCANDFKNLPPDKEIIARVLMAQALLDGGLNDKDFKTYANMLTSIKPDKALAKQTDDNVLRIMSRFMNDKALVDDFNRWMPIEKITTLNAAEQYHLRQSSLQRFADIIMSTYDLPRIPVILDVIPADIKIFGAHFDPRPMQGHKFDVDKPFIVINYIPAVMNSSSRAMALMLHEAKHAIDYELADRLKNYKLPLDDLSLPHIALVMLNTEYYLPSCMLNTLTSINCSTEKQYYQKQYLERMADHFAECAEMAQIDLLQRQKNPDLPPFSFSCTTHTR